MMNKWVSLVPAFSSAAYYFLLFGIWLHFFISVNLDNG